MVYDVARRLNNTCLPCLGRSGVTVSRLAPYAHLFIAHVYLERYRG